MEYNNATLGQTERFHLNAASGWLGLGDVASALDELAQIAPDLQEHPEVLLARCEVYFAAEQWALLVPLAEKTVQRLPELEFVWVNRSYALHELRQTQAAYDALLPAATNFPKHWLIHYNLACYCAQLGRREEALRRLAQASALAGKKKIKTMALADPDFASLRDELKSA